MRLLVLLACGIAALLAGSSGASAGPPWGPETPPFNLQVILHDVAGDNGFGHVKFRQPNDDARVIYLDTWVRDLPPITRTCSSVKSTCRPMGTAPTRRSPPGSPSAKGSRCRRRRSRPTTEVPERRRCFATSTRRGR